MLRAAHFPESLQNDLASIPGVQTISPVGRETVNFLDVFPNDPATALYLDPLSLPDTAWFRDDFAGKDLSDLLSPLAEEHRAPGALALPADAESVGLWARVEDVSLGRINQRLGLWVRVFDSQGIYRNILLGDPVRPEATADKGWTYFESPLPVGPTSTLRPPFSLVSIFLSGTVQSTSQPGSITIDDLSVKTGGSPESRVVAESFETPGGWVLLPNSERVPDVLERTVDGARSGLYGLSFSWHEALGDVPRGILIPPGPFPLPAIGGARFSVGQELRLDSGSHILPVVIMDTTRYFPTINPQSSPFLLLSNTDRSEYTRHAPGLVRAQLLQEDLWVSLEDDADRSETVPFILERLPLSSAQDRAALVDWVQRNPLAGGGWNGLTALSVSALTVAVVLALCAHTVAALHTGRMDLTIIRVLGFSRFQLLMSTSLERIVVAAMGIGAGTAIGFWLGSWVLGVCPRIRSWRRKPPRNNLLTVIWTLSWSN